MKQSAGALSLKVASVLLSAFGSALGVWLQVQVAFSLEESEAMPRYVGVAAGISVGALVAWYTRPRSGKWWTIVGRVVPYNLLGYPLVGIILYALAFPVVDRAYAHFVAGHLAVFAPVCWLPLLIGLALVERRSASARGAEPASVAAAKNKSEPKAHGRSPT